MGEGHAVSRAWPYSYGALGDGTRIDDTLRGLYDEFVDEHDGDASASPFTVAGSDRVRGVAEPAAPGRPARHQSRACSRLHDRADLRGTYPDLTGADRDGLLALGIGARSAGGAVCSRG